MFENKDTPKTPLSDYGEFALIDQLTKSFKHAVPDLDKFKSAMSFLKMRDVQYNKSLLDFLPEFEDEYKQALPSEYLLEDMGKITDNVPPIIMYNI
jgi:hypothetical protein